MQLDNYLLYLEKTVAANPDKAKKYLIKRFLDAGIATKREDASTQLTFDEVEVDISSKSLSEQLLSCLRQSKEARLIYEEWEFFKDYKYSVLYSCDTFSDLLERVSEFRPLNGTYENEYIFDSFSTPVAYHTDEASFLKFNLAFSAVHPISQEELLLKYPFLVVFHKSFKLIEFRFDVIKRLYVSGQRETTIYADLIASMKGLIEASFHCSLTALKLDFMINVSKRNTDIKLIAQYMRLPSGGNAQLEVGNNQEYVLPFIGEIKSLLANNQTELDKAPTIRESLEQFIYEMEEMSDYPWIELLWENEIKTRSIRVKFIFNYMNNDYCLIQHYYSNVLIGMERMNYVVKYIVDNRNDDTQQTE